MMFGRKVNEELSELAHEVNSEAPIEHIEDEFGDVLFSLINYARFIGVNPENALAKTNKKFIGRFTKMEELLVNDTIKIEDADLELMDTYWEKAKRI